MKKEKEIKTVEIRHKTTNKVKRRDEDVILLNEITDMLVGLQADANRNFIDFDAIRLYQSFYEQDKILTGSNKKFIGTPEYDVRQDRRIDCCLNRLNYAYEEIKQYYIKNGVNE